MPEAKPTPKAGPVPSGRFQMLREGLQEAEARVFVENALLDRSTKLGPDLAKRCKEVCDSQTRFLRYLAECQYDAGLSPHTVEGQSQRLFELTADVAKALAKQNGRPPKMGIGRLSSWR